VGKHRKYSVVTLSQKVCNIKAFHQLSGISSDSFSRPPRYDLFAIPPCVMKKPMYRSTLVKLYYSAVSFPLSSGGLTLA